MLNLPFVDKIARPDGINTIDVYISDEADEVLAEGRWQRFFKVKPEPLTKEEKQAWLAKNTDVALGSDAFFPFGDNIERAHRSGVKYVAEPAGLSGMITSLQPVICMIWSCALRICGCSIIKKEACD